MKKYFWIILIILLSACATGKTINYPVIIPEDISGVIGWQSNKPEEYEFLDYIGADWLLATFYWRLIEPAENEWNYEYYDKYVDISKEAGKKIIGVLGYSAPWIFNSEEEWIRYVPPDKMHHYANYARNTAERYRGKVDAWCIWNEPNFHFWKGTRKEFGELTRQAVNAIREADPDVIILGGGYIRGIFGPPKAHMRSLFKSGGMEKADGIAFHPYELNPSRVLKMYKSFAKYSDKFGFGDRVWVTEIGYPTGGLSPTSVSEEKFPAYVISTFVNLAAEGAQRILWYQLFDPVVRSERNSEHFFGLARSIDDFTSKGSEAFRLCAVYLSGTTHYKFPDEGLPNSLKKYYFENPEGGGALVLWKKGIKNKIQIKIPGGGFIHNHVTGEATAITAETTIIVGSVPVFITWDEKSSIGLQRVR